MNLDHDSCYRALLARDPRFDGLFFVGVKTTKIYCRPVCTARTPYRVNCTFYPSAAAAESARFRPCLRCRPELAPGQAPMDAPQQTAWRAAARIQAGALTGGSLELLADELGVSSRQLRRVTKQFLGASPVELAQTQRLLLAKQLLTETRLPVIDVALASGFSSVRRFNALVRSSYGMTPRNMRRKNGNDVTGEPLTLTLAYRPPLAWREMLDFLALRAIPGVEQVIDDSYLRTVSIGRDRGWVRVRPRHDRATLIVDVAPSLLRSLPEIIVRLRGLFDLNARPDVIAALLAKDARLRAAVRRHPGLRVPGGFDEFEVAVRAVVGQQNSVRAATTISGRLAATFGDSIETPFTGVNRLTPTAETLVSAAPARLAGLGLTSRRAQSIVALAKVVADRRLTLAAGVPPEETIVALAEVAGIGDWTAQYIAMRALRWPDAFPAGDLILKRFLGDGSERRARLAAEAWRPWRAYGAMYAWMMRTS
ncbi:MAG TPA: AlkA N-terminal domain-containing protein [Pirellulales bacterium]|jgi:AraC family transcriptional regulator of adaptative response / DNA-3-methyladenine glycosylase II